MARCNVKCHCRFIVKIHKYERAFLLEKYAHNITQYGGVCVCVYIFPWWCLHHITHYKSKNLLSTNDICWCWNLTYLFNLSIEDCMFIASRTKNSKGSLDLIVIGHTRRLEEAWLLVLVDYSYCFLSLALHSNYNLNGFVYRRLDQQNMCCIVEVLSYQG